MHSTYLRIITLLRRPDPALVLHIHASIAYSRVEARRRLKRLIFLPPGCEWRRGGGDKGGGGKGEGEGRVRPSPALAGRGSAGLGGAVKGETRTGRQTRQRSSRRRRRGSAGVVAPGMDGGGVGANRPDPDPIGREEGVATGCGEGNRGCG